MYVINIMLDRETVPEGSFNQSFIERDSNLIPGPTERTLSNCSVPGAVKKVDHRL